MKHLTDLIDLTGSYRFSQVQNDLLCFLSRKKEKLCQTIPLMNIGDLAKPATALIEKIADATGTLYEPKHIVEVAKAQAEAAKIQAKAKAEVAIIQSRV